LFFFIAAPCVDLSCKYKTRTDSLSGRYWVTVGSNADHNHEKLPGFEEKSVAAAQPIMAAAWEAAAGVGET